MPSSHSGERGVRRSRTWRLLKSLVEGNVAVSDRTFEGGSSTIIPRFLAVTSEVLPAEFLTEKDGSSLIEEESMHTGMPRPVSS